MSIALHFLPFVVFFFLHHFHFVQSHFYKDLPPRGYVSRGCGFSRGFAECDICRGVADTNPDRVVVYIDCDTGVDSGSCGSVGSPCGTLQYSFDSRTVSEKQMVFCFRGICSGEESLRLPEDGGIPGHRVVEKSGSEEFDFEYPTNPLLLVGWDSNGNGEYPPHDTNDIAVIDGRGLDRMLAAMTQSYVELAHFTVTNYGSYTTSVNTGFWKCASGSVTSTHVYFHDIAMIDVNKQRPLESGINTFNWFGGARNEYLAFENFYIRNISGYVIRGSSGLNVNAPNRDGPVRYQNFDLVALAPDGDSGWFTVAKLWGYFEGGFEILDSVFESGVPDLWRGVTNGHTSGLGINLCTRDFVIRNNHFMNFASDVSSYAFTGYQSYSCWDRGVTNILVDHNEFEIHTDHFIYGAFGVALTQSPDGPAEAIIEDYAITNNVFRSSVGWQAAFQYAAGGNVNVLNGVIVFANNTIDGGAFRYDHGAFTIGEYEEYLFRHEKFLIYGNRVMNVRQADRQYIYNQENVHFFYLPSQYVSDYNIYDSCGQYFIDEDRIVDTLAEYQAVTGFDAHSKVCGDCSNDTDCSLDPRIPDYSFEPIPPRNVLAIILVPSMIGLGFVVASLIAVAILILACAFCSKSSDAKEVVNDK